MTGATCVLPSVRSGAADAQPPPPDPPARVADRDDAPAAQLELEAEAAIRAGDFARAEAALESVLAQPESRNTDRARELLGLVRERTGRIDDARRIYRDYVARRPEGPDSERVQQRLAALEARPREELREHDVGAERDWRADTRGAFTQTYLHDRSRSVFDDASTAPVTDHRVNVDELLSTVDVASTVAGPATRIEARASAGYVAEHRPIMLVGSDRQQGSYSLLYERSLNVENTNVGLSARLGRQTRFGDGIFGRFDGTLLGWQIAPRLKVNAFTGHPVWSPRQTSVDDSRTFRGSSLELSGLSGGWWLSLHSLDQQTDGLVDRRSVGGQVRINASKFSFGALLDYDRYLERVNAAYVHVNRSFADGSVLSVSSQRVHQPTLSLTNSIIGQPIPTIEAVHETFDPELMKRLARDRTLGSRNTTMTYSRSIGERFQITGDASVMRTSESAESALVPLFARPGTERSIGVQLVGRGLAADRDVWIADVRSARLGFANVRRLELTAWLPVTEHFSIAPRLQLFDIDQRRDAGSSQHWRPSIRFLYGFNSRAELDASIGSNAISQILDNPNAIGTRREDGVVAHVGYRIFF